MSQQNQIHLRLAEMVRELSNKDVPNVDAALEEVTAAAVRFVPGADASGMTVVDRRRKVRTVGATTEYASLLDDIQGRHEEGPCLSAAWDEQFVQVEDLSNDERWPQFREDALAETPCRSSLSFKMFTDDNAMGALNLYAEKPHAFTEESLEIGLIFATHSAVIWRSILRDSQYRSALASRDIIGQAKGMMMERFGIDADQAFALLTRLSQESNTKLADVAHRLVDAERHDRPA